MRFIDLPQIIGAVENIDAKQLGNVLLLLAERKLTHGVGVVGLRGVVSLDLLQIALAINTFNAESLGDVLLSTRYIFAVDFGTSAKALIPLGSQISNELSVLK